MAKVYVTLLLAVVLAGIWCPSSSAAERLNVLFIAIDDLNDWVGFLGGHPQARTPNMDRLGRRGIVFTNAHCAAPLCCPSRAAVFSGRLPVRTGVFQNSQNLRRMHPRLVLLPQHFKKAGYRTFGTGKLLHRRSPELFDEHFFPEQRWSPFTRKEVEYRPAELASKGTRPRHVVDRGPGRPKIVLPLNGMPSDRSPEDPKGESFDWGPVEAADAEMGDAKIADWAADRLRRKQDKPIFLAVGFYRPHIPLFAPRKYFEDYPVESIVLPKVLASDLDDLSQTGKKWALEAVTAGLHATVVKYGEWKAAVAAYLACVSFVDAQIGKLLHALERGPHAEDTVVVLWSDHGWHLGEKEHWGKWTGWERSTRVPLIVVPARRSRNLFETGGICAEPVSLVDLYPTLVELCGLESREGLDGVSLVPQLRDPETPNGRAVLTTFGKGNHTLRARRWRLVRYADGSEELYDHADDPPEWKNLAGEPARRAVMTELRKRLPSGD